MAEFKQDERFLFVKTPFGADALLLRSFSGREEYSRPFHFQLELIDPAAADGAKGIAEDATFYDKILGKSVEWGVRSGDTTRTFHGIVRRFTLVGLFEREAVYHAEVVPKFWLLTLTSDCRVYQEQTTKDIVSLVFNEFGITDAEFRLQATPPTREYCVQYRETYADFVQRLLEEEGIHYHFEFADGKHTIVVTDKAPTKSIGSFTFDPGGGQIGQILSWTKEYQIHSAGWELRDFDFQTSSSVKTAQEKTKTKWITGELASLKHYDFPGDKLATPDLKAGAIARVEEDEARAVTAQGASTVPDMAPGTLFSVSSHPHEAATSKFALIAVDHAAREGGQHNEDEQIEYQNRFVALLDTSRYRPPRVTRQAVIDGVQTAKVVGPKGQEIYTDKFGRVRVQFHWDRLGKFDEKSSCWVRVSQAWAGDKFGVFFHPRIGQEVIVSFMEGNPDRPVITGRVHNDLQMPPYALPDEQNKSGIKTHSTTKGSAETYNELRFTDTKEKEEIYFHAERDFDRMVENNDKLKVGFKWKDPGDQTIDIYNDRKLTIEKGKHIVTVKTGDETITIEKGNRDVKVSKGNQVTTVSKGDFTIKVDAGHVTIEAKQSITLKCGKSVIKLEPMQTTMTVAQTKMMFDLMNAKLDSSMVAVAGKIKTEIKAPMTDVKGDAMLKMKGGVVMIN